MIDLSKDFKPEEKTPSEPPTQPEPAEKFEPEQTAPQVDDMFSETEEVTEPVKTEYSTGAAGRAINEASNKEVVDPDELFKEDGLSGKQKIILIVVAVLVVALLAAGGYLLYAYLNDSETTVADVNTNQTVNKNINENINENVNFLNANDVVANVNLANTNVEDLNLNVNTIKDADADGLSDADEIRYGTDMNNADSDGDGYTDGDEVANGYNPLGEGKL